MKKIVVFLVIVFMVFSCKKDNPTKTELLTKSPWTQTAEKYNPPIPVTVGDSTSSSTVYVADFFEFLYDCAKDDIISFQPNGLYKWETGPTDCDDNGQGVTTASTVYDQGSWVFNTTETSLTLSGSTYSVSFDIVELSNNKLVLTTDLIDTADNVYTQTNEYIR